MSTEYPSPNDPRLPAGWPPPPPSYPPPSYPPTPPPAGAGGGGGGPRRRGPRVAVAVVAGVALLAVGGGVGGWAGWNLLGSSSSRSPIQTSPQGNGSSSGQSAASKVAPAIANINTTVQSARGSTKAAGTGIVLTSSGEVLTNNHVVEGATSIQVSVQGHGTHTAKVLGVDPSADVALIQLQGVSGLPTAKLADSSSVKSGQSVTVLGNACGQGGSPAVEQGTVTGVNQAVTAQDDTGGAEKLTGMIGVAANILPGDSGGAVVNSAGQVIGMTTAGNGGQNSCGSNDGGLQSADRPGSGSGGVPGADVPGGGSGDGGSGSGDGGGQSSSTAGYAVPTNTAVGIVNQIRAGKASADVYIGETGFLGVQAQDLTQATAERLGLSVSSGVLVIGFASSSPANDAGIQENSAITAVAGKAVTSAKTLQQALAQHKPGDKVSVSWTDGSGSHSSTVTLGSGPPL